MSETPGLYMAPPIIRFTLIGAVVPKARPRVTCRGTFMPRRYRDWKAIATATLFDQARAQLLDRPLMSAAIQIDLIGKHPRRGDLDNIAGSILDVLVQAGIIRDDSIAVVTRLAIALQYNPQPPTVQIQLLT